MFKVTDATGAQVLINPLQISYIRERNKKSLEIMLAGMDDTAIVAGIRVDTDGRDPSAVMEDWELQLDRWYSTNL